jgi:hypothetical protein
MYRYYIDIFILFYYYYYFIRILVSVFKHMYIYEQFNIIIYVFQENIFMDMKIFIKDILIHIFWRSSFKFQNRYFRCYKFYFSTCLENLSTNANIQEFQHDMHFSIFIYLLFDYFTSLKWVCTKRKLNNSKNTFMKNTCIYLFYYFYLIWILGLYKGKSKHTTCRALHPRIYQPSPSISRSRPGLTALTCNAPLTPAAAVQWLHLHPP